MMMEKTFNLLCPMSKELSPKQHQVKTKLRIRNKNDLGIRTGMRVQISVEDEDGSHVTAR